MSFWLGFSEKTITVHFNFLDDEDESERRKGDCLDDIQYLEQQFSDLKQL